MTDPFILFESLKDGTFTGDVLRTVDSCISSIGELDKLIGEKEEELKKLKGAYDLFSEKVVPGLLSLAHTKSLEMDSGAKVSYKEVVFCSLPKEDLAARERALSWLSEHGASHIIKDQVVVESPTKDLIEELTGRFRIERKRDVHAASLKAFMTELLGVKENSVARLSPDEVPQELHLYLENKTTVKESKTNRSN